MPTCQHCAYTWTYSEALKTLFTISTGMTCPNCQEKQYAGKKTRNTTIAFIFFAIALALGLAFTLKASLINVAILFILFAIYIFTYPFMLELQNEELKF